MSALVAEVHGGASLLLVDAGRLWRCDRLSRDGGFSPWREVTDAPGIGGRILSESEVSRLVAPYGVGASKGQSHE
jgi:hypothetical protein